MSIVPGLHDNLGLGIRRGRLCVTGPEVEAVFDPVVQEVITLITDQIKSTKQPVKAILMVGGFGQSAYLRDRVREAVGSVEVMQSPNGSVPMIILLSKY